MPKDLRTFLNHIEATSADELACISSEISVKWEVAALQVKLEKQGKFPVIVCEAPVNGDGRRSPYRLVTNVLADRRRCAEAIGVLPERVAIEYSRKANLKIPPLVISKDEAPVKETVWKEDEVDLSLFPIPWHHELDPGPYITAGFFTTIEPETGIHNCSIQRCWIKSKNKTGIHADFASHNRQNLTRWWASGRDAPVAVWVGHHPAAYLGGQSYGRLGYPEDHYPSMGGLLEEPLRLVPSETFGDQLLVPADAEVVIEGLVPKDYYEAEGPFGERPGYTGGQRPNPIIQVTCVTCRRDAYWQDILVGHRDNHIAGGFAIECLVYERVKAAVPEVLNVHAPPATGCRDHVYIQVRKRRPGIGREAAVAALTCRPKHSFIFDDDVDIFDEREVMWAIATRSQWDRDLIVVPTLRVTPLDPSVPGMAGLGTKAALDCTQPAPPEPGLPQFFTPKNKVPDEVMGRIELETYLARDVLDRIPTT